MRPLGVVLTAGLGTRLQPLTPATPKPLVPLLNRPLIAYALDLMRTLGLRDVAVVIGPDDATTAAYTSEHAPAGLDVTVATQHQARGPGDAVACVGDALGGRSVAVLAVDTVLRGVDATLLDSFEGSGAVAGLLLQPVEDARSFGCAVLEGERIVHLEEKPAEPRSNLALVGLWVLAPLAVERVRSNPFINAKGESDLTATVAVMLDEGDALSGWVLDGDWFDGGTLEGLLHAQLRLLPGIAGTEVRAQGSELSGTIAAARDAVVAGSRIVGPTLLGAKARVEGCSLSEVVVGDGAALEDVELARALVAPGARLRGRSYTDVVVTPAGEIAGPGAGAG